MSQPKAWSQDKLLSPIPISAYTESYSTHTNDNGRLLSHHHHYQQRQHQHGLSFINYTTIRYKHSQTQIKRLFKNHPARLRVEKRLWNIDRKQPRILPVDPQQQQQQQQNFDILPAPVPQSNSADTLSSSSSSVSTTTTTATQLVDESNPATAIDSHEPASSTQNLISLSLLYPSIYTPKTILPNGWFEPMDSKIRPIYPFHIPRTKNKPKDTIGFLPIYTKYRYV
jgi:hypothetical protein